MTQIQKPLKIGRSKYLPLFLVLLELAILGAVIAAARQYVRQKLREQIAGRDAQFLYASSLRKQFGDETADSTSISNQADQLATVVETLQLPQLSGFFAARLFDPKGDLVVTMPPDLTDASLDPQDLAAIRQFKAVSHFHPKAPLSELLMTIPGEKSAHAEVAPLHEIIVPLHAPDKKQLVGIVQYYLHGENLADEFALLDARLTLQSLAAFVGGGALMVVAVGLAFRRLERANRLLAERTESLLKANQELAMAAKISAIGSVTAHLIHGLKNPLFGLQNFVSNRGGNADSGSDTEWQAALSSTRRMQTLVNDVVRVLREENSNVQYQITLTELVEVISSKAQPLAKRAGVELQTQILADGALPNREANLLILILENLIHNAIQASPSGQPVELMISAQAQTVVCEVRDHGPGLAETAQNSLFAPCRSSKEGGSGIGLAISKQLANHLGAALELKSSSPQGCVFSLSFPKTLLDSAQLSSALSCAG